MAKVLVRNNKQHDITISLRNAAGEIDQVTIPAGRGDGDSFKPGEAMVDDGMLKTAVNKYESVAHYFNEEWLVVVDSKKKTIVAE